MEPLDLSQLIRAGLAKDKPEPGLITLRLECSMGSSQLYAALDNMTDGERAAVARTLIALRAQLHSEDRVETDAAIPQLDLAFYSHIWTEPVFAHGRRLMYTLPSSPFSGVFDLRVWYSPPCHINGSSYALPAGEGVFFSATAAKYTDLYNWGRRVFPDYRPFHDDSGNAIYIGPEG